MRCLYCGRQLALLRKLTGGGEFCSEAHRKTYQDDYNRLALSRLLQTHNSGEEPASAPPPSAPPDPPQRVQKRAGSVLDLDIPPAPRSRPEPATLKKTAPPAEETGAVAKRQAGFVRARLPGLPGVIITPAKPHPSFTTSDLEIGLFSALVGAAAIRRRSETCLRISIPGSSDEAAPIRTNHRGPLAGDVEPMLQERSHDGTSERALVRAPHLRTKVTAVAGQELEIRQARAEQMRTAAEGGMPPVELLPLQPRAPLPAPSIALSFTWETQEPQVVEPDEVAAFRPHHEFLETVSTGFVAGLKLGEEQIRFELPVAANQPEMIPDGAPESDREPHDDETLPHDFIAAVQALDACANGHAQPAGQAPEKAPAEEPTPAVAGQRMCEWLPLELAAVPANARQRLMATFQAVGLAAAAPATPEFGILPVRPKYVVEPVPVAGAAKGQASIAVADVSAAPAATAVAGQTARHHAAVAEPAAAVGAAVATRDDESAESGNLQAIPVANSLDFLQEYDKRGQSVFSKFLGKIGSRKHGEGA